MSSYSVIHNNGSTNYFCLTLVFLLVYCANGCFASKVIDEDSLDLAKALDAAVITTLETGEVQQLITQAGFTFTLAKDCDLSSGGTWPDVDIVNGQTPLAKVLRSQKIVVGRIATNLPEQFKRQLEFSAQMTVNRIAEHYNISLQMIEDANSTSISQLEEKVENDQIDFIMPNIKGVLHFKTRKYECCTGFAEEVLLYSLPSSGISDLADLNVALALYPDSLISAATRATQDVLSEILKTYITYEPDFNRLLYSLSTGQVIAISGPGALFINQTNLVSYRANVEMSYLMSTKRHIPASEMYGPSDSPKYWEQGNEQLADYYQAAVKSLTRISFFQHAASEVVLLDTEALADCQLVNSVIFGDAPVGTMKAIVSNATVVIGAHTAFYTNCTSAGYEFYHCYGHATESDKAVFNLISDMLFVNLNVLYKLYNNTEDIFDALDAGEVDLTFGYMQVAKMFNNQQRKNYFIPSCYLYAAYVQWLVSQNSSLNSQLDLQKYCQNNPKAKIGVFPGMENDLYLLLPGVPVLLLSNDSQAILGLVNGDIVAFFKTDHLIPLTENEMALVKNFSSTLSFPIVSFFRRDKQPSCGDQEVESIFNEQCDSGPICTDTCTCPRHYKHDPNGNGCIEILKPWQIVLVAFGCLVVVVSPLIIVVLWYKRKVKTVKAGYVKFTEQGGELRKYASAISDSETDCSFSKKALNFGTDTKLLSVEQNATDSLVITNGSHRAKTVSLSVPEPVHKFKLHVNATSTHLAAGDSFEFKFTLTPKCTSDIFFELLFQITGMHYTIMIPVNASVQLSTRLDADEIEIGAKIGQGAAGSVYRATWRGLEVAVKTFPAWVYQEEEFIGAIEREIDLCVLLRSPNVVTFYGSCLSPDNCFIVMEFVELGSLHDLLHSTDLQWWLKLRICKEIAQGMLFLHSNRVMHRDLKPANVLVASLSREATQHIKLSDFGSARIAGDAAKARYTVGVGTPNFTAPEVLSSQDYSTKADVFSFSILVWCVLTQNDPYSDIDSAFAVLQYVCAGNRPVIPENIPSTLKNLITSCWAQSPDERPDFAAVIAQLAAVIVTI